ncbi:MAG: hypothetical protein O7G83_19145, partial [Proteobacteria bacterium]|nr:hypothetical protein [Pseudomonadota bacterium]
MIEVQFLLAHHLKKLKLPTFLREHEKIARLCAAENMGHTRYLLHGATANWNVTYRPCRTTMVPILIGHHVRSM